MIAGHLGELQDRLGSAPHLPMVDFHLSEMQHSLFYLPERRNRSFQRREDAKSSSGFGRDGLLSCLFAIDAGAYLSGAVKMEQTGFRLENRLFPTFSHLSEDKSALSSSAPTISSRPGRCDFSSKTAVKTAFYLSRPLSSLSSFVKPYTREEGREGTGGYTNIVVSCVSTLLPACARA